MKKIRSARLFSIFLLLASMLFLSSCTGRILQNDFRDGSFKTLISFTEKEVEISAYLTAEKRADGGHDLKLEIVSPTTMSGVTVYRQGEAEYAELDKVKISDGGFSSLLDYAELVIPSGDIHTVTKEERDGRTVLFATVGQNGEYEIYLDPISYIPTEIRHRDRAVYISEFTKLAGRK